MSPPHLLVALSGHGYGHAAQTTEVVNRLCAVRPGLRVTVWSELPAAFLDTRFDGGFERQARAVDVGMAMASALRVDVEASAKAYAAFHADWPRAFDAEARALERLAPDLVLANVPYRVLAAAARAGIPAVAMCSLNWADIYRHYFPAERAIHAEIVAAYRAATAFLRLAPGMPMADLENGVPIGPVARLGRERRAELRERLALGPETRLVMIAPGGLPLRLPIEDWPSPAGVHYLVPAAWGVRRAGVSVLEEPGLPYIDLLCSVDALVTKPGYGSFTEAACNGVPLLYVARGDWPEEPYLVDWIERHARAAPLDYPALARGALARPLERLWSAPAPRPPAPAGIDRAVTELIRCLGR